MGDLNNIQIQPNVDDTYGALQRQIVANYRNADSHGDATNKHHLCSYTDEEKTYLIRIDNEERQKGKGFMERMKRRWDEQYPGKRGVSRQNLRDNASRYKKENGNNESENNTRNDNEDWTLEMKVNLIKIDRDERKKGRGFMKRIKEAWDKENDNSLLTAQCLRDNATRFKKDKAIMNLIEVREGQDAIEENRANDHGAENAEIEREARGEGDIEVGEVQRIAPILVETEQESMHENEDEETRELRIRFVNNLQELVPTTKEKIEERKRLLKIKVKVKKEELERANNIIDKYLEGNNDICKVIDAVYAMARTIEQRLGMKQDEKKRNKHDDNRKNRRIRKLEDKLKKLRQAVARVSNELYRRKTRRKATEKEKEILRMLKDKAQSQLINNRQLLNAKEKWIEELRYVKVKIERTKIKEAKIRDNNMFREDQGNFYKSIDKVKEKKGKVPEIGKFVNFWAGIWEDESITPYKQWMKKVAQKITEKVTHVAEIEIDEEKLYKIIRIRKNWSAPGIDGIQNFWWKKLAGVRKSMVKCMIKWIEDPEQIPKWITDGRTVLLPKTENLTNEKDYRPITCLNTCYKIFTGMIANYMKEHADRNNIWDKSQLGTCSGVLGTVDQLLVDKAIMDEVSRNERNLAVAFYDYQKAYDMVRHDWMERVYTWMRIPGKVINVLRAIMGRWRTRLEINDNKKMRISRWIKIKKGFLQGDSYSPVGFCLTEIPIAMLMEETDGYRMGAPGERDIKRTHSFFIDDLKVYQESHEKLEVINETIVNASMDTGACYGVKKCAEIVFKEGKMVKGEGLAVLDERMKTLDPSKNEFYKFLGCEQKDKIDVKMVLERVKQEVRKRTNTLVNRNLNDKNLMQAINTRVIPVAGYVMNVCKMGKGELDRLDKIIKEELRKVNFHGKQASDERLYTERKEGGRGLKSFKDVYQETKVRVACYLATSTDEWLKKAWGNEYEKDQTSLKIEVEEIMEMYDRNTVKFERGFVEWGEQRYDNWKVIWRKLKKEIKEGAKKVRLKKFDKKKMQSEITSGYTTEDYGWLSCNTDPRKTAAIFSMLEQMVETKVWKKLRGNIENDSCRLCGDVRETVQHLLSGCKKIVATEYVRRHDNALKILAVEWGKKEGLLPKDAVWYKERWERGRVIEKNGKKILWDWEHRMRTHCKARRPDLTLEDETKKEILIIDMACPAERNKETTRKEKMNKYQQLCFELRERRRGFKVKLIPVVIGCCGGGTKDVRNAMSELFEEKTIHKIANEMQKTVLWESETILRKILSGLCLG